MTQAKLVILRHGETDYNVRRLMTGQCDVPLTRVGEGQARDAGVLIGDIRFDKVYSSHLIRAFNTAALALEAAGTQAHLCNDDGSWQIEQRPEIAELDVGSLTGLSHKTDPVVIDFNLKRTFDSVFPGGESERQMVERIQKFFDSDVAPRLLRGENVLIVAHAVVVRLFDIAIRLQEMPAPGEKTTRKVISNAAPIVYEYEDGVVTACYPLEKSKTPDAANQNNPVQDAKKTPKL